LMVLGPIHLFREEIHRVLGEKTEFWPIPRALVPYVQKPVKEIILVSYLRYMT
jgi:hypothetical protein